MASLLRLAVAGRRARSRPGRRLVLGVAVLGVGLSLAPQASSHARSASYSSWEIDEQGANVTLRLKLLELSRLGPEALPPDPVSGGPGAGALPRQLMLLAGGEPCRVPPRATRRPDEPGWVRYQWRVECPAEARPLVIRSRILLDVAPSHLHFARIHLRDEEGASTGMQERVLTEAEPELVIPSQRDGSPDPQIGSHLLDYLWLGVEHILTGWDHLAFVFGLLLLATRLGEVARLVTGFTLAHSLTLALAVLDWVHPRGDAVEAVIAFSVALVAIEKGWLLSGRHPAVRPAVLLGLLALAASAALGSSSLPVSSVLGLLVFSACYLALIARDQSSWLRICLTFAFGLVHGFGFAGILVEMTLPSERLVPALLGFNLGVEVGQIAVVLLLWPLMQLAERLVSRSWTRLASETAAAALCGVGIYWLIERAFPL